MMSVQALKPWLEDQKSNILLIDQLVILDSLLPRKCVFSDDCWNVSSWLKRGNRQTHNLRFLLFKNKELRKLVKLYTLHQRMTKHITGGTAVGYVYTLLVLDEVLGDRTVRSLVTEDFYEAQQRLVNKQPRVAHHSAYRLMNFSRWLQRNFSMRLSYTNTVDPINTYGRQGTDKGREAKLIPIEVLRDMVAAASRGDISQTDKFYLSAFIVDLATGLRISELATLPVNCLIETDGKVGLKVFTVKGGKLGIRWFPQDMLPAVKSAIEHIRQITDAGRKLVSQIRANPGLDWKKIVSNPQAFRYFTKKFANEWTNTHPLINPSGAWYRKSYIDVLGVLQAFNGNMRKAANSIGMNYTVFINLVKQQKISREGRVYKSLLNSGKYKKRWTNDKRIIKFHELRKICGFNPWERFENVRDIIEEAQALQLEGEIYPAPGINPELEEEYKRKIHPVIVNNKGDSLLEPEDALFVVPKHFLLENRKTKDWDYYLISEHQFMNWFRGRVSDLGTKSHRDSVFSRLGIEDPRTGTTAKIVWHDIRHWLNTMYKQGGLNDEQVALIMGRKKLQQNETYDQTLSTTRSERLSQLQMSVRNGNAVGQIADNYTRIASHSLEDAEKYLLASTRMINRMPHGACMLNMSMNPCPHNLSCFSCTDAGDPCKHLIIDPKDRGQIQEIIKINAEALRLVDSIPEESPQYIHFNRVALSTASVLNQVKNAEGTSDAEA